MNKIGLIIKREYSTRVKKKSFIIMTLLGPLLIVGFLSLAIFISTQQESSYSILVLDESDNVLMNSILNFNEKYKKKYDLNPASLDKNYSDLNYESVQKKFKDDDKYDLLLYLPENILRSNTSKCLYKEVPSLKAQKHLASIINKTIEIEKLKVENWDRKKYESIKTSINLDVIDIEHLENQNIQKRAVVGYIFAIIIYMFILLFGVQVMRGVIEEKTNRVVEVIVSSVRPFQLMMGKIIGIALVGLTQFGIWVLLSIVLMLGVFTFYFPDQYNAANQAKNATEQTQIINEIQQPLEKDNAIEFSEVSDFIINEINWPLMLGLFVFYFLGGYLLYGSLMAAIGSAVDSESDTQQFMIPITIPLIFAFILAQNVITNPAGSASFWLSEIPFTSPIVMLVRVAMGVGEGGIPVWEVLLSMGLLIITFIGTTWLAGKIYRTGILMYGKKASYKELLKWIRHKD